MRPLVLLCLALLTAPGCLPADDDAGDDDAGGPTGGDDDAGDDDAGDDDVGDDDVGDDDSGAADADGDGYTEQDGDCDDGDPAVFPGAEELCNGVDDDCDGTPDDDCLQCAVVVPTMVATIQDALDAAADGDVICVRAGTYPERLNYAQKTVTVRGLDGPAATVVDGGGSGPVVVITGGQGPDAVLEGLTITGGVAVQGGGLFVNGSAPTLTDLVVSDNEADLGGGMFIDAAASPALDGVVFRDNRALGEDHEGGGIYISSASPALNNVALIDNQAGAGGGIRMTSSQATLDHVVFAGNTAEKGGGLYVDDAEPSLTNVIFAGNRASAPYSGGGGLFLVFADADVTGATFTGNESTDPDGNGGALKIIASAPTLTNVIVAHNTAGLDGAGLDNDGTPTFLHCAFFDNDVQGGGITFGQDGNVEADPQFLDLAGLDPWAWDLHLGATSPLVDAGATNLDDPDGSPSDIGAYGGPGAAGFDRDRDGYPEWWLPDPHDPATSPNLDCDDRDPTVFPGSGC